MSIIIISEIGINHNGNLDLAKEMILESKRCGADIVKFQKRNVNLVYSAKLLSEARESPWGKKINLSGLLLLGKEIVWNF